MSQEAADQNRNPLFYQDIAVLNRKDHDKLRLKAIDNLEFAKGTSSIVLSAAEFSAAAPHYPIVFAHEGDDVAAYAVTGYRDGENVFVNEENQWKPDTYIPAYVRRYPFILAGSQDQTTLSLAVDLKCAAINKKSGDKLYESDEPSAVAKRALEFCVKYRADLERTRTLMSQLKESDLLVDRTATVKIADGEPGQIGGFAVVDEDKLNEMNDEAFLALRKTGLLQLIYCHLWSMRSWDALIENW